MSIFDEHKAFTLDKNKDHQFGLKSGIIWAYSKKTNNYSPILYLSKPKAINREDFDLLLEHISISFSYPEGEPGEKIRKVSENI